MARLSLLAVLSVASSGLRRKSKTTESHEGMLADDVASSSTAKGKLDYYWGQIIANTEGQTYMHPLQTLARVGNTDFLWSMYNHSKETRPSTHRKGTHGPGGHAKVHFEWRQNSYTGLFQQADHCIIRIANAAEPAKGVFGYFGKTSYNPNMGIKCFRDGVDEDYGAPSSSG